MKTNSETLHLFQNFKIFVETQFNTQIKSVQIDWGGEFFQLSSIFLTFGIHHRVSCPYIPQQNGRVERKNRHVIEVGLSMLAHSNMPQSVWPYAFQTAAYLINCLPSHAIQNQCPYEILYKKLPDYKLLRSFGCACYSFLRPLMIINFNFGQKNVFSGL